ncbi:MAG: hypothetical protein JXQ97_17065 [Natronospirillum sp.]
MTTKTLTSLALRVFALWLLAQLIVNSAQFFAVITALTGLAEHSLYPVYFLAFFGLGILAVWLLWRLSGSVLNRVGEDDQQPLPQGTQAFVLQILGVYFLVTALAYLPRHVVISVDWWKSVLPALGLLLKGALGLALVVRAPAWANLLTKLRG